MYFTDVSKKKFVNYIKIRERILYDLQIFSQLCEKRLRKRKVTKLAI